jgi:uncharacterized protein HemY
MTNILPENEHLRKAVKWISEHLKENRNASLMSLIDQATLRFDLNPKQAMFLINFYQKK